MEFVKSVEIALGLISILLATYSLLGFVRLTRLWHRISTLDRYEELFAYLSVFVAAFIGLLLLITIMSVYIVTGKQIGRAHV